MGIVTGMLAGIVCVLIVYARIVEGQLQLLKLQIKQLHKENLAIRGWLQMKAVPMTPPPNTEIVRYDNGHKRAL